MDSHKEWILDLAVSVCKYFYDTQTLSIIDEFLKELQEHNKFIIVEETALNDVAQYFIISDEPNQLLHKLVDKIKKHDNEEERLLFKPMTIITKLFEQEYILDINGDRIIYAIKSDYVSNEMIKSMLCRTIASPREYNKLMDKTTNVLTNIESISYAYDFKEVTGGRKKLKHKKPFTQQPNQRVNIKLSILNKLMDHIKNTKPLMQSTIYLTNLTEVDNHAMDIIYTEYNTKSAIVDYLKNLVKTEYKDYSFEFNAHQKLSVSYDFRLRKFSCYIKNLRTGANNYLVNLYNEGTYDPIPCYRINQIGTSCQLVAQPIIKLRYLYLDLHTLCAQTVSNNDQQTKVKSTFESIIVNSINNTYKELQKNCKIPVWIGVYIDEAYDRNQENMKSKMNNPYEVILI